MNAVKAHSSKAGPVVLDLLLPATQSRNVRVLSQAIAILIGALAVGALAQVTVPLYPVPITGQTLGVLLVGAIYGARRGALSLFLYMLMGIVGLPVFAGFSGGFMSVMKPSFGYILGFIPSAFVVGYVVERLAGRALVSVLGFGVASLVPFLIGVPWLWAYFALAGKQLDFLTAINLGFTPFIIGGIIKWAIAVALLPALRAALRGVGRKKNR